MLLSRFSADVEPSRFAAPLTIRLPVPNALLLPSSSVPASSVTPPLKVLLPFKVNRLIGPFSINPPAPEIVPLSVMFCELFNVSAEPAPRLI
jgi:hypothetical protein